MARTPFLLLTVLLGALTAIEALSVDMTLPAMPAMAAGLATDDASVQFSLSAFLLGLALGQLVHGPLSDRHGRKPVLLAGLALYIAATAGCAAAPAIGPLIGLRLVQGFAAAVAQILTRAIVRDRYDREAAARLLSYIFVVFAVAPIAAPVIGAHVAVRFGWATVFVLLAAYGAVIAVLIWRLFDETIAERDRAALSPARILRSYREIAGSRTFWGYLICSAAGLSAVFAYLSGSPAVMIRFLGLSPQAYGYWFAATMTGSMIALILGGRLVGRFGLDRLLSVGSYGAACSGVLLAALAWWGEASVATIVVPVFLYMTAFALIMPQATAGALSPFPHIAGAASSLLGFLQLVAASLTGALVGWFGDGTEAPMVSAMCGASLIGLAAYLFMVRRGKG